MRAKSHALASLKTTARQYRMGAKAAQKIASDPETRKLVREIERVILKYDTGDRKIAGSLYTSVSSLGVSMGLSIYGLDGLKCDLLTGMIFDLMGVMPNAEMSTRDYPNLLNRDYKFKHGRVEVAINAYVKEDSTTCKRVKIGSKLVEVDEYKIVCE